MSSTYVLLAFLLLQLCGLLANPQRLETTPCVLAYGIHGTGLHQTLRMVIHQNAEGEGDRVSCCIAQITLHIPSSMYVDPDQIHSLMQRPSHPSGSNFTVQLPEGGIDVEKPSFLSPSHAILVKSKQIDVSSSAAASPDRVWFEFPIHLRYPLPSAEASQLYTDACLEAPEAVLYCSSDQCSSQGDGPDLKISRKCQSELPEVCVAVPNGLYAHAWIVRWVTVAATWLGSVVIVWTVFRFSMAQAKK